MSIWQSPMLDEFSKVVPKTLAGLIYYFIIRVSERWIPWEALQLMNIHFCIYGLLEQYGVFDKYQNYLVKQPVFSNAAITEKLFEIDLLKMPES